MVTAAAGHRACAAGCDSGVRAGRIARLAGALLGLVVLVAGMAGGIGRAVLFFVPALVVLAVAAVKLWRERP